MLPLTFRQVNNGGAMFDHDLQLQQYILNTFKTVAEQRDFKFLARYGIDQETALHMRELDNHCIQTLAKSRPFTITVSNAAFARKIEDAIDLSKEQRLVREAIILGASRESLSELAYVTDNTFKKISLEVGKLPQTRGRPKSISLEKIDQLAVMHANIIKLHLRMGTTISNLEIMVMLSKVQNIEFNRIYIGYFKENVHLLEQELNREKSNKVAM